MLILPQHLTDKRLSAKEALLKFREKRERELDKFRLPDQAALSDWSARVGRPLKHTDLITKVVHLSKHKLWAEESWGVKDGMNFYTMAWDEQNRKQIKVCCESPFLKGYLPEYTVIHPDNRNMPRDRTPGWREVIFRLISKKFLKYSDVVKAFGVESPTNSDRWLKNIQPYR